MIFSTKYELQSKGRERGGREREEKRREIEEK